MLQQINDMTTQTHRIDSSISKFEFDVRIHCCQSAADEFYIKAEQAKSEGRKAEFKMRADDHQQLYNNYAYIWKCRFGSLWMQKISWSGEVLRNLTDWYLANEPENAPAVDKRSEVMS